MKWKRQGFFSRKKALQYQKNSLFLSSRRKAAQIAEEHGFLSSSERAVERTEHEQSDSDIPEPDSGYINVSLNDIPNSMYVYSISQTSNTIMKQCIKYHFYI